MHSIKTDYNSSSYPTPSIRLRVGHSIGAWNVINEEGMNVHFETINAKIALFENLLIEAHMLIPEQLNILAYM